MRPTFTTPGKAGLCITYSHPSSFRSIASCFIAAPPFRYRIDIGVVDPRAPGRYLLGVERDGAMYHSGATARDRDRLRQHVLEGLGWELYRIWSTDWWLNPEEPMRKLVARLEELVATVSIEDEPVVELPEEVAHEENVHALYARGESAVEPVAPVTQLAYANPESMLRPSYFQLQHITLLIAQNEGER
ncbi:hypothetical protein [Paraburkholderia sp. DGU8]|uniref:hypothetical protein n=1 Tax=Paraburkholderia sp. DGU8 TaxID=3161997 RepID=UPI003466071D